MHEYFYHNSEKFKIPIPYNVCFFENTHQTYLLVRNVSIDAWVALLKYLIAVHITSFADD